DHFLSLDPTVLTIDLLKQHLLAAETSVVAVGAARGTPRTPFFEGCSPSPLPPSYAFAAAVDVPSAEDVGAACASAQRRSTKGKGGRGGGGGSGSGGGGSSGGSGGSGGGGSGWSGGGSGGFGGGGGGSGGSGGSCSGGSGRGRTGGHRGGSGGGQRQRQQRRSETQSPQQLREWLSGVAIFDLDYDAILSSMYALSASAEGDYYRCVPPDPRKEAPALSASESSLPGTAPAEALHTFTLDSGASRCFFCDSTTLTPLPAPVPVRLADPSGGLVVARSSTVLSCPAVLSGSLSGLHLPSFSTNLRVSICTCTRTGHHLATFTCRPGSSLYTLATEPPQVVASAQVSASGQLAPPCSCRLLSHQTLLWHHRLGHPSLQRLRGIHFRLLVSGLPRSLPPLPPSPAQPCLPCVKGRQHTAPHSSSFPLTTASLQTLHVDMWGPARVSGQSRERYFLLVVDDYTRYTTVFPLRSEDLPVLRLHSDRGGVFSSDLLRDFCRGEGILQSFTLPASPQQNEIVERLIGLVVEVARTSMIHVALPHFLWPFAVRYAAHQLNLWPRVSLPETSPTLRWTGEVGDASVFRVWGSRVFVRDTSADKLSARAVPCSVPFYRLFPYRSAPPLPPPLFLAPGPPPVDPLPPQGPSPSGASQVDPLPGTVPVEVAGDSSAARGAASRGAEPVGAEPGGAEPEGVEPGGAESESAKSGGAESRGAALSGGPSSASPRLSPRPEPLSMQQLHEWLVRRARLWSGAAGAGATGDTRAGGAGVTAGAGVTRGTVLAGRRGAHTRGTGAAGIGGVGGTGAGNPTEPGAAGTGGAGARGIGAGAGGARAGGTGAGAVDPRAGGAGAGGAGDSGAKGTVRPRPYFVPLLQQVLGVPSSTSLTPPLLCPPPDQSQLQLQLASPLPAPSPYTEQSGGLTERREPASRPVSPVRTACRIPCLRPPPVPGTQDMAFCPSSVPQRVPLPPPPESSLPAIPDPGSDLVRAASPTVSRLLATVVTDPSFESIAAFALVAELLDLATACRLNYATALVAESKSASPPSVGGECALGMDVLEDRQEDIECLAAAAPRFASLLLAPEGDPDAPDIPTPCSYAEAITGPYSSQWQTAMDVFWHPGTPQAPTVKRPPGSPPAFKARYIARGFSQRRGVNYFHTFSPTPKMTTLWVLLHVAAQRDYELHSLDFSTAFLQGSLHVEIWLRHPPGFTGSFPAGTQWSLRRPVYGLRQAPHEWHDTLRTTLAALGFAPYTADPSLFLRTDTSLLPVLRPRLRPSALQLPVFLATAHSSIYQPLALSSTFGQVLRRAWGSCLEDGVQLSSSVTQTLLGSSCEAEIYAGAMAAQGLRWLTYFLTDLGEQPRSPPVLYVDNKAMIALCREHRLEHKTKHIALRYFLARELQQRGQIRRAYVATRANTADEFTKALPPGDHQRFSTVLGLLALLFLTGLMTTCSPPICLWG
ncbi:unnamed protein product, partial [Closterium sp. NIES-53]